MKKNISLLILFFASVLSLSASAAERIEKMKVMEVTNNGGTVWALRLNEHVDHKANPLAYDADLDCVSQPGPAFYAKIELNDVRSVQSKDEPYIFTEFGYVYDHCEYVRKQIQKNYENNKTSCLYFARSDRDEVTVTDDESKCDE